METTMWRLKETELIVPEYTYTEKFDSLEEAQARMKDLYHNVAIEGDHDMIEHADINDIHAIVVLKDGNEIEWNIEKWSHLEEAVEYVSKHKTWSEAKDDDILDMIGEMRCSVEQASPQVADEIRELMNEYGEENGLEEDWWMAHACIDDIYFSI